MCANCESWPIPTLIGHDLREERFIVHTLQLAIQAMLDVAPHMTSDLRLGEPVTNQQLFTLLGRAGWIPESLLPTLRNMAGFRNILVHGYQELDLDILRDEVVRRLFDLMALCRKHPCGA